MSSVSEKPKQRWRPFHETVVDAIRAASLSYELDCLGVLIIQTAIPENHQEIADAYAAAWQRIRGTTDVPEPVIESLRKQMESAARVFAAMQVLNPIARDKLH